MPENGTQVSGVETLAQLGLPGISNSTLRKGRYLVYHDESESMPDRRWLLIGLLFVRVEDVPHVQEALKWYRHREDYWGEVHFSDLPKDFQGKYAGKARLARQWMLAYANNLREVAFFTALAVDRHSPKFEHRRFSKDFHAYNRFTAMALKSGIAWHLGRLEYDEVEITFITDAKSRASSPENGMVDNFEVYLPYRAELDASLSRISGKRYPDLTVNPVRAKESCEDDCLQLTDLLLGACQVALTASARRLTKCELGLMICRWCDELRKRQDWGMYRKFSFQVFPDAQGRFSNPSLALSPPGQLCFLE